MNKLLLFTTLSLGVLSTACNKCAECHYDKDGSEVEIGEYCKDDLESIENEGYYDTETDTTYEVHCHDH